MNKRFTALVLTLILALGAAVPALAADPVTPPIVEDISGVLGAGDAVSEDPVLPAETDAALDQVAKQAITPEQKEEMEERILIIKDLRAQGEALTEAMQAQHATNQQLWESITADITPLRDQVTQLRDEFKAWVDEQIQPLKDEVKNLQAQYTEARQNKDQEAAAAIKAEMEQLRAEMQDAAGSVQARRDELKAMVDELKAKRDSLPVLDELKALTEQGKAIHDEIIILREQRDSVWEDVKAAREAKDADGVIAGLDHVISLQKQILADRDERLSLARQIGTILAAIN